MADLTISSAASLTSATLATGDLIPILDISAGAGSKGSNITADELRKYGAIANLGVAYVQTNGNDDTGEIGNPAKPYLTAQVAYNAGARVFDVGVVNAGTLTINQALGGAEYLFFRGVGITDSFVTINNYGANGVGVGPAGDPGQDGPAGENPEDNGGDGSTPDAPGPGPDGDSARGCTYESDGTIYITVNVSGGDGGDGGVGGVGGNGGSSIEGSGGNGGDGGVGGAGGSNGGPDTQVFIGCVGYLTNISVGGLGAGGAGGAGGVGGDGGFANGSPGIAGVDGDPGSGWDPASWGYSLVVYRRCTLTEFPPFQCHAQVSTALDTNPSLVDGDIN